MYWDLGGREICWHAIRRRGLRAVHNADLTVTLLDQGQVDGVRLKFIDLFETIFGHGSLANCGLPGEGPLPSSELGGNAPSPRPPPPFGREGAAARHNDSSVAAISTTAGAHAHPYAKSSFSIVTLASFNFSLASERLRNSRDSAGSSVLVMILSIIRPPVSGSLHIETM